jgi:hypothetical protein
MARIPLTWYQYEHQVSGTWYLGPGIRYRINAEDRTPSTEDRARPIENAHTGYAGYRTHDAG